jgi:integrase
MPRTPRIPSYRCHRPTGLAVVTLNGRDIYLGKYGTAESRREYDRQVELWLARGRTAPADSPDDLTVVELVRDYLKHAEEYYRKDGRPTSQLRQIKGALKDLRERHGPEPAAAFDSLKLDALRQSWVDRGLCRKTCNGATSVVKQMFQWGSIKKLVPKATYWDLRDLRGLPKGRTPARDNDPIEAVPESHLGAVLPYLSPGLRAVAEFMLWTGCRPAEAVSIRPRDIDRSGEPWVYKVPPEVYKSSHLGKKRFVAIGPKGRAVLEPRLATQSDPSGYIFRSPGNHGGRPASHYLVESLRAAIARACPKTGIPHFTPNQIRHLAATRLRAQFGLDAARTILGHSDLKTTEIYAEMDIDKARAIMESVG